jgi:uncharacterized membrane protein YraQ (UPF0718 family)
MDVLGDGLWNAFQMAWEVTWALVLGFLLSAMVQAWVPRERMQRALGARDLRSVALATGLGAASSSCSYAAVAIAKSMFQKGASLVSAMAFQFASTNLVFELGIVMWIFLGWRFTLAELVGGLVLIVLLWGLLRRAVTRRLEEEAREHAVAADNGHEHGHGGRDWAAVAHYFVTDWKMLWKEIVGGFLISGFVALVPASVFDALFLKDAPAVPRVLGNVLVGPLVAVASFVCSVGNIPLAAVLWARGISFAGVLAFVFADLLIVPIVLIYRRYYGGRTTVRLVAVMFAATVAAALVVDGIFSVAGLVPETRPDVDSITSRGIAWNYTTVLDIVFLLVAALLLGMARRRGERRVHRLEGGHAH